MQNVSYVVFALLDIIDTLWAMLDDITVVNNMTLLGLMFGVGYILLAVEACMHIIGNDKEGDD